MKEKLNWLLAVEAGTLGSKPVALLPFTHCNLVGELQRYPFQRFHFHPPQLLLGF